MNDLKDFVIIEFIETEEVATVSKHWIREDENGQLTCFWPGTVTRKAVVSHKSPQTNWETWTIRILSSCDQIEKMQWSITAMETTIDRKWDLLRFEIKEMKEMISAFSKSTLPEKRILSSIENTERAEFEKQLPFTNLKDFLELENSLENDEKKMNLMMDFFQKIGGSTVEDSVRKTLIRLVTNEVAVNFSWEGRKGKRALHSLLTVKTLKRVLAASHGESFTHKAFETRVKEWFRQAGTRIYNLSKKNLFVQSRTFEDRI